MNDAFMEECGQDGDNPLDWASQDFDWEGLCARMREEIAQPDTDPRSAQAVVRLLDLLLPRDPRRLQPHVVGLRVIALAWTLSPAYFEGSPSLRELAQRCDVKKTALTTLTGEMSRHIGWRNRSQQRAWNWHAIRPSQQR